MLNNTDIRIVSANCFTDLQRSAVSLLQNPNGKTHLIFLEHAIKVLKGIDSARFQNAVLLLSKIDERLRALPKDPKVVSRIADEILTAGILIRGSLA